MLAVEALTEGFRCNVAEPEPEPEPEPRFFLLYSTGVGPEISIKTVPVETVFTKLVVN